MSVYPNPATNRNITLQIGNARGNYSLYIYNMYGAKVSARMLDVTSDVFVTTVQLPASLPKGSYQVVLQNDKNQFKQLVQLK